MGENLIKMAKDCGFTHAAELDVNSLEFLQEVRDMCNEKQCPRYGKSWACPPACGSLEDMRDKVKAYGKGVLVQTVGELEDSYDWDGIQAAMKRQSENFIRMWDVLEKEHPAVLAMGTGGCSLCENCTYTAGEPCRFPNRMAASMEACGLYVSKVCTDNNLAYNYGPGKIAYTACFLIS